MENIKLYCKDCGKEMPKDEEKSNENWNVYAPKCTCGGEMDVKRMVEDSKNPNQKQP